MVAAIGALVQLVGVMLLAGMLLALRRYADVRGYFGAWTLGWAVYAASLAAIVARYAVVPGLPAANALVATLCDATYIVGKLLFSAALAAGAARFAGRRVRLVAVAAPVMLYAGVAWAATSDVNAIIVWQAPVAALASLFAAATMLGASRRRPSVGMVVTGTSCLLLAALWACYGVGFHPAVRAASLPFFTFLVGYSRFVDLLLAMMLGFGMVVLVLEDAKHAADRAHAELSTAHEALRRIAAQDALTGALNRTAFRETASLGAAFPAGALVLVDLDDLKVVNDGYGHAAGDRLLAQLAATLRRALPDPARVYRWGGDEFVVVAPGTTPDVAHAAVASALAGAAPLDVGTTTLPIAASLGAAPYADGAGLERAVAAADDSMYADKVRRKRPGGATPARGVPAAVR